MSTFDIERLLDQMAVDLRRLLAAEGRDRPLMVGIRTGGVWVAELLHERLGIEAPLGELSINFYRDDLTTVADAPVLRRAALPFAVTDKTVILVDDVLYTGRTARAAIEAEFTCGRPRAIQFAVLVDRGHRELPIRADYVGKNVPTAHSELIEVHIPPYDGDISVNLMDTEQ